MTSIHKVTLVETRQEDKKIKHKALKTLLTTTMPNFEQLAAWPSNILTKLLFKIVFEDSRSFITIVLEQQHNPTQ